MAKILPERPVGAASAAVLRVHRLVESLPEQYVAGSPVVLMTTFDEPLALTQGVQLGANACLLKDAELDSFAAVLRKVAGGATIPLPAQSGSNLLDAFTPRELEVIRELCAGKHNKEIASALNLSAGTVRNYVSSIMEKLGVQNRARALLKLRDAGLG